MRVSVIATVKNESETIERLLDSLLAQTRQPDEMIFVDGGSDDNTLAILRNYERSAAVPLRVLEAPGSNISAGRNVAIAASTGEIIVSTDAGVRFERNWLESLVRPFQKEENSPDVVCGFFMPDPQSVFEIAMGATVLPDVEEIVPERFLPSSRSVAFRRAVWENIGGYPEWMSFSEDLLFDLALKNRGYRFVFAPEATVRFRPRSSLAAFWRQYRNYALGDGEGLLWTQRHLVRYGTYVLALPLLIVLGLAWSVWWWVLLLLGLAVYLRRPYARLRKAISALPWKDRLVACFWVPVIRVWGDLAKMVGYPMGLPRGFRQRKCTRAYLNR